MHQDDTGWRNSGQAAWLGVYCSSNTVLYTINTRHTHQEVLAVLGEAFKGVLVSDRYTVYDHAKFAQTQQQKCVAHLIRNADEAVRLQEGKRGQGIVYPQSLAKLFRASLKLHQSFHAQRSGPSVSVQTKTRHTLSQYRLLGKRLEQRLTLLLERKPLKSKENERLRVGLLKQHRLNRLLYFLTDPSIPPTNNAAERALRPAVISRKVSQCSKSQGGADTFAKFKSVVETAKLRGQIPFEVLTQPNLHPRPG